MRRTQRDASTHRRTIEKRSRERIGHSLKELKRLLPNFKQHGSKTGEQMDLLQSAVDYLKSIQTSSSIDQLTWATDPSKSAQSMGEGPLPSLFNPAPAAPVHAMMDGFQDCMEETIRYLVQVEGLPPSHDLVVRLRAHLLQYRSKLGANNTPQASRHLALDQYAQRHHRAGPAAADSTQTSPQLAHTNACAAAYPPGSALLARSASSQDALHPATTTAASGQVNLPHHHHHHHHHHQQQQHPLSLMKPLTVDTNQYYAMPSPLSHCLSEGALARQSSSEPLLTIARTLPTNSGVQAFSAQGSGATTVSGSINNTLGSSTLGRTVARSSTMVNARTVLPSTQSVAPSVANSVSGSHLGFNLNYVAPYLVAFVRPAAQ